MPDFKQLSLGGMGLLGLLVLYLLFRVQAVTGERDSALQLAGAYQISAEASGKLLEKIDSIDTTTQKLVAQREKDHAEILQNRSVIRAEARRAARQDPALAAWLNTALPALYLPGPDGLLGQTAHYSGPAFRSGFTPGQLNGPAPPAALAGAN